MSVQEVADQPFIMFRRGAIRPVPVARRVARVSRNDRYQSRAVGAFAQHGKRLMTR